MGREERRYIQVHQKQLPYAFTPDMLIGKVRNITASLVDHRNGNNTQYTIPDVFLSALSVFFMQCPSFLAYQESMEREYAMNNARNLFWIEKIPSDPQIRNVLDAFSPSVVFPVFAWCFDQLVTSGGITTFKSEIGYLIALDGTQYFSSDTIHCADCLTKTDKKTGKMTYYHTAVTPVIVKPGEEHVLSLAPECIMPQDGSQKQDCEINASKRLLLFHKEQALKDMEVTYLGDDLYAHEPFCRDVIKTGHNFIFVCKPESHKTVYEWIKESTKERIVDRFNGKKHQIYTYKYMEGVPLRDTLKKGDKPLLVNFVEVTVTDRATGKQTYHSAFVTNHALTGKTEEETGIILNAIVDSGRARWKIENENNNTLKTKGYYFEHNYGHGKKYLSSLLMSLILIAFLFHTLLDMTNLGYQQIRNLIGARVRFFNDLKTLTIYSCYRSFDHLFSWMYEALTKGQQQPNHALSPPLVYTSA